MLRASLARAALGPYAVPVATQERQRLYQRKYRARGHVDATHVEAARDGERCLLCGRCAADEAVIWRSKGDTRRTPTCERCRHSQDYRDRGVSVRDQLDVERSGGVSFGVSTRR
jgi:hypothetical protein